jgi:hypothetical protein
VLSDGTLWTHAATLGTRYKQGFFTIDKATIENFIKVFKTGYPQKVCVDYEHSSDERRDRDGSARSRSRPGKGVQRRLLGQRLHR